MPEGSAVRLALAPIRMKPVLRHLLTQYLVEFAAMEGSDIKRDTNGHVPYRYFDQYWSEPERFPFGIWVDDELCGFCLLRDSGEQWNIAEFFVAPVHRRKGIGAASVSALKEFCRLDGRYQAIEASTLRFNARALAFWRSQDFMTVNETADRLINVYQLRPC